MMQSRHGGTELPTSYPGTPSKNKRSYFQRYKFFRRLLHFKQMDFEIALNQMFYLCVSPQRVYRSFSYHKSTKNQWARDDPAFLVLLSLWLCLSSIGMFIVFRLTFFKFIELLLWVVFVDFIGVGLIIASVLWVVSNRFLKAPFLVHSVDQNVEWGYAFDVHCNAFFPLLMILHVLQLFLVRVIVNDWFISAVVADTLWLIAISYYVYITFLGYSGKGERERNLTTFSALPFLSKDRTPFLLYPIGAVILLYLGAILSHWNISLTVFRYYGLHGST